jgi:prepilin-type processing-associated H-X9-DG protein
MPPAREFRLLLLGLGIERAVPVPLPTGSFIAIDVSVSPGRDIAVVHLTPERSGAQHVFFVVRRNGRVGPYVDAPLTVQTGPRWDDAGNPVFISLERNGATRQRAYHSLDLTTGQMRTLTSAPPTFKETAAAQPLLPFRLVTQGHDLSHRGMIDRTMPVWLETDLGTEHPSALVTADGHSPTLLPGAAGVLFQAQGALWSTPLVKMKKSVYVAARTAELKQRALSNARQVGTAARMYMYDNNETFPGPDGIEANLSRYAGSAEIFQGLNYTFAGGNLADIDSPAATILGNVAGPGGSAVVFADGHVKWVDN